MSIAEHGKGHRRNYRFEPPSEKRHPMHRAHGMKEDVVIENEAVVLVPIFG